MLSSSFFRRLFIPFLLLIWATIGVTGLFAARSLRNAVVERVREAMESQVMLFARAVRAEVQANRADTLERLCRELGVEADARVTIIRSDGVVLGDSWADPASMENHSMRPEVAQARSSGKGHAIRESDTVNRPLLYVARRIDGGPDGRPYVVRVAADLDVLSEHLGVLYAGLGLALLAAMAASGLLTYLFARRQTAPILELTSLAGRFAQGSFHERAFQSERGELGRLALSLNMMAESLDALFSRVRDDKTKLETILSSMGEGVIATDNQQHIILVNEAAGRLLSFDPATVSNKALWEVVLNDKIIKAASDVLNNGRSRIVQLGPVSGRFFEASIGTFPPDGAEDTRGLLIVTHDTTQSVRYQELRKEFVANVSHELRTPLSVIKGFVETLADGALQDPQKAGEYLATISRHTNQLTNLVNDLLEISRLDSNPELPQRTSVDVGVIARRVAELLMPAAQRKKQELLVTVASHVPRLVGNSDYLERAVCNLVDNAIKYTPEGGKVVIDVSADATSVFVNVTDNGLGIPEDDLPRIFERFYRVDRSRSREMGGTGLGLSIVKHLAQLHRGTVEVNSTPGEGSTFRLILPVPKE